MNMKNHSASCKRHARQLKKQYPSLVYNKRLDLAAQIQGFKHFTALSTLLKLLGPDKSPSTIQIVSAGGDPKNSPYNRVTMQVTQSWNKATPVSTVK